MSTQLLTTVHWNQEVQHLRTRGQLIAKLRYSLTLPAKNMMAKVFLDDTEPTPPCRMAFKMAVCRDRALTCTFMFVTTYGYEKASFVVASDDH
jgi:hypothetical protein